MSTYDNPGVNLEVLQSQQDIQDLVNEYGSDIYIYFGDETLITRDKYNSIKTQPVSYTTFKVYSFIDSPTQNQLRKAGFFEKMDAIAYLAYKDFLDKSLDFKDIDTVRSEIVFQDITYNVKEKNRNGHMGNSYMYIILGLTFK